MQKVCVVQIINLERTWLASKNEQPLTQISENAHKKEAHVRVKLIQQGKEWLANKKEKTLAKLYKIQNQKNIHTGPTKSVGKSFPNRSEFALVVVGKDLVAQYDKS